MPQSTRNSRSLFSGLYFYMSSYQKIHVKIQYEHVSFDYSSASNNENIRKGPNALLTTKLHFY